MKSILRALRYGRLIRRVYTRRFAKYGRHPAGIFWSNEHRQLSRFKILLDQILFVQPKGTVSVADVGCGYGAMLYFIRENRAYDRLVYSGYDINPTLIKACKNDARLPSKRFHVGDRPLTAIDFSVMSGTYNMAVTSDVKHWEEYFLGCLRSCWRYSRKGMVFNLLCAEQSHISDGGLYYANVHRIRAYCKANFGITRVVREPRLPSDVAFMITRV
jgi:SAM-dependent methyltransferase